MTSTDSLSAAFGHPERLVFEMSPLGGVVAKLRSGRATVIIALQGAQILSWTPQHDSADVLWLSPMARLGTGKPLRGGIPVCWPWFGPHSDTASGNGAHGFVRAADWRVMESAITPTETRLTLGYSLTAADEAALSGRARLSLQVALSDMLDVSLTSENTGLSPLIITEALHSYFTVSDIAAIELTGLQGRRFFDQLSGKTVLQQGSIAIPAETDRIYWDTPDTVIISDTGLRRRVSISKRGSASTVVWNPWRDKAERLGDIDTDGFRRMVCVETANVRPLNPVSIAPGQSHTLAMRIEVLAS
jgi:glucose-6-phosphate 1-epimerase